jgi:hypothetical protein
MDAQQNGVQEQYDFPQNKKGISTISFDRPADLLPLMLNVALTSQASFLLLRYQLRLV